ncbi:unnamed protein product, partial [Didymodactylos carnosus]
CVGWNQYGVTVAGSSSVSSVMYIGDYGNNRILKWSLGATSGTIFAGGNGYGCAYNQFQDIYGIVMDSDGYLYVSDFSCNWILKFPSDSNSTTMGILFINLTLTKRLFIDLLTNDLYVTTDTSVVYKISVQNNGTIDKTIIAGVYGSAGSRLNQLHSPIGVYYDYQTEYLYVADYGNHRILRFPSNSTGGTNGTVVAGITAAGGISSKKLNLPRDLIVDRNGIMYISDGGNNRVQQWLPGAKNGTTILGSSTGATGTGANRFNINQALAFDSLQNLIVADGNNNRVQFFNCTLIT